MPKHPRIPSAPTMAPTRPDDFGPCSRPVHAATPQNLLRNRLRNMTMCFKRWPGLRIPQIPILLSINRTCLKNYNLFRSHIDHIWLLCCDIDTRRLSAAPVSEAYPLGPVGFARCGLAPASLIEMGSEEFGGLVEPMSSLSPLSCLRSPHQYTVLCYMN